MKNRKNSNQDEFTEGYNAGWDACKENVLILLGNRNKYYSLSKRVVLSFIKDLEGLNFGMIGDIKIK
jgi:hypothetical protein